MAPREFGLRTQQSINMLKNDESITFEELIEYKHSTHLLLADRLLDDLWEITESHGSNGFSDAVNTLQAWDRKAENDSRGTVLFYYWIKELGSDYFAIPWSSEKPLTTPNGLRDSTKALNALTRASKKVKERFGSLDVTWGEVNRLQKGETEYPSNGTEGSFGAFRVSWHDDLDADEKYENIGGDSFYGIVEFSDSLNAEMLLPYGNTTQPSMPSFNDQLKLYSEKKLRPILFSYDKIKQGMVEREVLDTYED
jgi:acyl-homoserine-lactone acylase